MKDLETWQQYVTVRRLMIVFAVFTAIGWAWAIADAGIPPLAFFLFGVASPFVLFITFISRGVGQTEDTTGSSQPPTPEIVEAPASQGSAD